jgi:hypothetical protein
VEDVEPEALHLAAPAVEGRVVDPQGLAGGPHDELPGERNAAHPEATEGNVLGQDRASFPLVWSTSRRLRGLSLRSPDFFRCRYISRRRQVRISGPYSRLRLPGSHV